MAEESNVKKETIVTAPAFTKEQLKNSSKFAQYKDIIGVVLNDGESYTIEDCEKMINEFLNKKCERRVK